MKIIKILKKLRNFIFTLAWYWGGCREKSNDHILKVGPRSAISSTSKIIGGEKITIGDQVLIMDGAEMVCASMPPYVELKGAISIGNGSIIREKTFLITYGGSIEIGQFCTINPFSFIQGNGGVFIGDNVLIAPHVSIISANHEFMNASKLIRQQGETALGINISDDVWVGTHATILDGVKIGKGAVVAASALVNRDVEPYSVVAGVPARVIKYREKNS